MGNRLKSVQSEVERLKTGDLTVAHSPRRTARLETSRVDVLYVGINISDGHVFFHDAKQIDGQHFFIGKLGAVVIAEALVINPQMGLVMLTDIHIKPDEFVLPVHRVLAPFLRLGFLDTSIKDKAAMVSTLNSHPHIATIVASAIFMGLATWHISSSVEANRRTPRRPCPWAYALSVAA